MKHTFINADGYLCVKNISAYWLPKLPPRRKIGGTIYSVVGTYEGQETLDKKLKRIMAQTIDAKERHP